MSAAHGERARHGYHMLRAQPSCRSPGRADLARGMFDGRAEMGTEELAASCPAAGMFGITLVFENRDVWGWQEPYQHQEKKAAEEGAC